MQINNLMIAMRYLFKRWFHKRNIIIVSEHKVKHIPISGGLQFCGLMLLAAAVCWASYSTGSFMAARTALKEQTQTLRSVTSAKIENNLTPMLHVAQPQPETTVPTAMAQAMLPLATEPMATTHALEQNKIAARMAMLESRITELQATNEAIVQRVKEKTSGRIEDLENIVKQTGLDLPSLKKEAVKIMKPAAKSEGGPYIPAEMIETPGVEDMLASLDELAILRQIVGDLPLAKPIRSADEQSNFGHRIDPFTGHLAFHSGLDLAGPAGAKIYSTADGTVTAAGRNGSYGNAIDVDHGYGVSTRYGHLSAILVREGQKVHKGDVIGIQGSTGRSTGPHLHYEVRYRDRALNPKKFLTAGTYVSKE